MRAHNQGEDLSTNELQVHNPCMDKNPYPVPRDRLITAMQMSTEKDGLETGAITQFATAYNSKAGAGELQFIELRSPPEPDGYCLLDGQPLYIEVGHIYGTQSDVKRLLGRTGKSAPSAKQKLLSAMVPLDHRLLVPLNNLLLDKATKTYAATRVWLLIRSAFPLWDCSDYDQHLKDIVVPKNHPFEQIWLLCGQTSAAGAIRLV